MLSDKSILIFVSILLVGMGVLLVLLAGIFIYFIVRLFTTMTADVLKSRKEVRAIKWEKKVGKIVN